MSADRLRIETFLRWAARSGLLESATTAEEQLTNDDADERLFSKVRHCAVCTLHIMFLKICCLPNMTLNNFRKRRHNAHDNAYLLTYLIGLLTYVLTYVSFPNLL